MKSYKPLKTLPPSSNSQTQASDKFEELRKLNKRLLKA